MLCQYGLTETVEPSEEIYKTAKTSPVHKDVLNPTFKRESKGPDGIGTQLHVDETVATGVSSEGSPEELPFRVRTHPRQENRAQQFMRYNLVKAVYRISLRKIH